MLVSFLISYLIILLIWASLLAQILWLFSTRHLAALAMKNITFQTTLMLVQTLMMIHHLNIFLRTFVYLILDHFRSAKILPNWTHFVGKNFFSCKPIQCLISTKRKQSTKSSIITPYNFILTLIISVKSKLWRNDVSSQKYH